MSTTIYPGTSEIESEVDEPEYGNEQNDILADALAKPYKLERDIPGPQIGEIVNIDVEGNIMVEYPAYPHGEIQAQLTSTARDRIVQQKLQVPMKVLLLFENGRPERPIIIDTLNMSTAETSGDRILDVGMEQPQEVTVDGKHVSFNALEEIVLRCGKASITLTHEGRVIIRGAHVVSRSTGTNKIKGGSVQIN